MPFGKQTAIYRMKLPHMNRGNFGKALGTCHGNGQRFENAAILSELR